MADHKVAEQGNSKRHLAKIKLKIRDLVTNLFQVMREFVAKTRLVQSQVDLRWFLFYMI